jgi:hypothetical protein
MSVFVSTKQKGIDHPLTINKDSASETLDFCFETDGKIAREGYCRRETFANPAVTLRTTRFKIKKFQVVITLRLCVLYGSQNKQQLLPYKTLRELFL